MSMQCGNPLYLEWIGEWMESARENNSQSYYTYRKAYESMAKYPTRFSHPSEAVCLTGIGEKTVIKLERRLIEYCRDNDLPMPTPKKVSRAKVNPDLPEGEELVEPKPKKARQRVFKPYVPSYRSGAYAILITLLDAATTSADGSLTRNEITTIGQVHCDASLTNPEHGKFFTAWSSMKTLLEKNLVYRSSSRYYLTEEGTDLAERMRAIANETEPNLLSASSSTAQNSNTNAGTSQWESRIMDWCQNTPISLQGSTERAGNHTPQVISRYASISATSTSASKSVATNNNYRSVYDDDDFDGWDDIPNNKGLPYLGSTAPKLNNAQTTSTTPSSSLRPVEGNRDQPVNIISGSEDENDDSPIITSTSNPLSRVSSSSGMESLVAQSDNLSTTKSTLGSSGLRRSPTLFKIPPRTNPIPRVSNNSETPLNRHSSGNRSLNLKSSDSLLLNTSRDHGLNDHFTANRENPSLQTNGLSFSLPRSDSSSLASEIKNMAKFQPFEFQPGTFDIFLVLDIREVRTQTDRDYIGQKLMDRGVNVIKRALDIGDVIWVARQKDPCFVGPEEIVLDYVVERKRMDDLVHSIKDGRFNEQKFRLKRSGLGNVIYLVETHRVGETYDIGPDAIRTATTAIQIHDNFFLRRTNHTDHTIDYLVNVTNALKRLYEFNTLYVIPDEIVNRNTYLDLQLELKASYPDRTYLTSYRSFGSLNGKSETIVVKDMFVKMLMTIRGVSSEKALEIARIYKTPHGLFSALSKSGDLSALVQGKGNLGRSGSNVSKKRKIGPALSAKIASIWYTDEYPIE